MTTKLEMMVKYINTEGVTPVYIDFLLFYSQYPEVDRNQLLKSAIVTRWRRRRKSRERKSEPKETISDFESDPDDPKIPLLKTTY